MNVPYQKSLHPKITKENPYINWFKSKRGQNKSDRMFNNRKHIPQYYIQFIPEYKEYGHSSGYEPSLYKHHKQRFIKHVHATILKK